MVEPADLSFTGVELLVAEWTWSLEPSAWCGVGDVLVPDGGEPLPGSYQFDIGINCQHGH